MESISLVAGRDYPDTYRGFVEMFPDEAACEAYLAKLRWPQGFVCPGCESNEVPRQSTRGRLVCPRCRHRTTVSAGTIFGRRSQPGSRPLGMSAQLKPACLQRLWNVPSERIIESSGPCCIVSGWPWSMRNVSSFPAP